ncbi:MAG: hypothetical protein NTX33_09870 [Propionibacteriales bacterium]|nr:hypothetical protein [Propionibacteriales bacterium]
MTVGGSASAPKAAAGKRKAAPRRRERPTGLGKLGSPRVPRPSFKSKFWRIGLIALAVLMFLAWFAWYATTPEDLPTDRRTATGSGVVGTPLYIGMFSPPDDFGRTLRIAGVRVHATASAEIKVTPVLCRRGTVGVTTQPEQFCSDLINPEGERMIGGDSIVLRIESDSPAVAVIDRIEIAYREDVRWGTQPAGRQQAIVTVAGRPEE